MQDIQTTNPIQGFRLSPQQQYVWETGRGLVSQCAVEIQGDLDPDGLRRALTRAVERHEILHTTFQLLPGMNLPVQVVAERGGFELTAGRWEGPAWGGLCDQERETAAESLLATARSRAFDLAAGPVLRVSHLAVETGRSLLLLTLPALVADRSSTRLLAAEVIADLSGAAPAGETLQYADVAEIFHEWLEAGGEGSDFWARQDLAPLARLELGRPGSAALPPRSVCRLLGPERTAAVEALACSLGAPPWMLLLAAWNAALWSSTGESELVVGTVFDGRTVAELETAVGLFARVLPVRCAVGPDSKLTDLVSSLSQAVADAAEWQDAFAPGVATWPAGFEHDVFTPDLHVRGGASGSGPFGLLLSVGSGTGGLRTGLSYAPERFTSGEAERFLSRCLRLLDGLLAAPGTPLAEIDVLSNEEWRELLAERNQTASAEAAGWTAQGLFEAQARTTPGDTALAWGALQETYAELNTRANQLAHHLRSMGVGPDARVAICLERSAALVEALFAVLKAGGAYVPLDPGYPAERLAWMLNDCGASVLLTQEQLVPRLTPLAPAGTRLVRLDKGAPEGVEIASRSGENPAPWATSEDLAYVIYTSGSTGRPKGVMVPHRGLANYLVWARQAYRAADGHGAPVHSAFGFDLTVTSLLVPLVAGTGVLLLPEQLQGIGALAAALRDSRGFALVKLTPAHLEVLRQSLSPAEHAGRARALVIGGEALRADQLAVWRENAPETRLINEYGPTEATVGCCVYEVKADDPAAGAVPIGRPIANTRLFVVGPGWWPVPAGAPGELWIGGDGLARGYLGRPDLTAERFTPDPFSPLGSDGVAGDRVYRTGDLVRLLPSGDLEFLGRIDSQIKIRGFRIEPGEIEATLNSHPTIAESVVVVRDSSAGRRLVAYVVPQGGESPAPAELRSFLSGMLPDHMVPSAFLPLDALPLTANGKVDRRALPEPQAAGEAEAEYVAPRTLTEDLLAEIWAQVLKLPRVGIDDHFFSLGGDSIRSIKVLSLAQERGIELSLREIFRYPTIRSLAEQIETVTRRAEPRLETSPFGLLSPEDRARLPQGLADAYPLTRLQAGMVFHSKLSPDSSVYHDQHSFHLRAQYDREMLAAAIEQVVRRHPVLRTSFELSRFSEPVQLVYEQVEPPLAWEDLRHLPAEEQPAVVQSWLEEDRHRPFDWTRPPLVRFHIHRRAEDEFQFTLSFHHSVLDGWSAASLLTELFGIYASMLRGSPPASDRTPATSFRDFVQLERSILESAEAREFWRQHLAAAPAGTLPRWPAAPGGSLQAQDLPVPIPRETSESLRSLARAAAVPIKSVLLAAHFKVLALLSGQTDVVTGLVSNGRPEGGDADQILGMFLNTLPLRLRLRSRTWKELALEIFDLERSVLPFRRFPLADLQTQQQSGFLFEVSFNFLHYHVYEATRDLGGLEVLRGYGYEETSFPLVANFSLPLDGPDIFLWLNYPMSELSREQAESIGGLYVRALTEMAASPSRLHDELFPLSPDESRQVLHAWGRGATEALPAATLPDLFEEQVRRSPAVPAVVDGSRSLTYAELNARANRLAHHLLSLGVAPDVRVGLCLERSLDLVAGLLAVLKAGGAYVPLDPAYPAERLTFLMEDASLSVLLTRESLLGRLEAPAGTRRVCLDAAGTREEIAAARESDPARRSTPANLAYVIYTSGSTGQPKGVMIPHQGLVNYLAWAREAYRAAEGRGAPVHSAIGFDLTITSLFAPLVAGSAVHLLPEGPGVEALASALRDNGDFSLVKITPAHLELLRAALPDTEGGPRALVIGGEALRAESLAPWRQRGVRLINEYGPTETVVGCCVHEVAPDDPAAGPVPIGRPIANTRLLAVGPDFQPVPAGTPGELWIGGSGVARGYLRRPGLTAERFVPDPVPQELGGTPGERFYRTGDLVRLAPNGRFEYLGRLDDQVKVRGFRIEPGEIEAALRRDPEVREAAVVVEGQGAERRLLAFLVLEAGQEIALRELREDLRKRLPEPMLPAAFLVVESLPLTVNGKVDRKALLRLAPGHAAPPPRGDEAYAEPRSEAERRIAAIWRDVLRLDRVGLADNFFDLGGHSLLLLQVQERLQEAFGRPVAMIDLFRHPTVRALAGHLSGTDTSAPEPVREARSLSGAERDQRIAVVGMAGRFPGAGNVEAFWENLRQGLESITALSEEDLEAAGIDPSVRNDPNYVRANGVLEGVDLFDADLFGFTARDAEITDPQHRIFLECSWEALETAGYDPKACPGRVGVFASVSMNTYVVNLLSEPEIARAVGPYKIAIANDKDFLPTLVSYKLNLKGPSINVQTACSSSLVAVHLACRSLLAGECDMALAGGASVSHPQRAGYLYQEGGIRSSDGHCRAFDARAQGMVGGSGAGVVVLKRLVDALEEGDPIHAVLLGSAVNNDGSEKIGYTAPSIEGQAAVISSALNASGVDPRTITYVETHGTGTPLGDPIEVAALTQAFRTRTEDRAFCALGAVKTNVGHLDAAAGVTGLIKAALSVEHRQIPPSLHFEVPNPKIDFASSPFYVNARLAEWEVPGGRLRAGVSAFGIGGTNAHVILEEPPALVSEPPARSWQVLTLSARTPTALEAATDDLRRALEGRTDLSLADAAFTLQTGRHPFAHRRAVICRDLEDALAGLSAPGSSRSFSDAAAEEERGVVFLLPGQGAQHPGMGAELYRSEPVFREHLDRAAEILLPLLRLDLRELLDPAAGDAAEQVRRLEDTAVTQPALFAVEHALARLWMSWGVRPRALLGHSVGEYVAACLAGVFSLEDGLALMAARGRMIARLSRGAMLSLPLPEEEVLPLLGGGLALAAVNGVAQCVVAGPEEEIQTLLTDLASRGIEGRRLHTSHAFHSAMMEPVLEDLSATVAGIRLSPPRIPYVSNLTGTWITEAEALDPSYWARHLRATVRFAEGLTALLEREPGCILLEVGPGRTLSSLARRHPRCGAAHAVLTSIRHPADGGEEREPQIPATLGRLWTAGVPVDWKGLHAGERRRRVPLPTYPFERRRYWIERRRGEAVATAPAGRRGLDDWFHVPFWKPIPLPSGDRPSEPGGPWLVFLDDTGLGERLLESLRSKGIEAVAVRPGGKLAQVSPRTWEIAPAHRQDYDELLARISPDKLPGRVLHLWSVTPPAVPLDALPGLADRLARLEAAQSRGFYSLLFLTQALAERDGEGCEIVVLSTQTQKVTGGDATCPEKVTALGLCRMIPREHSRLGCRFIDLEPVPASRLGDRLIERLTAEVLAEPGEPLIAYRGLDRWVQDFQLLRLSTAPAERLPLTGRGVYLIAGGLGGVGLELAEHLAKTVQARLVLVGRSGLPPEEEWDQAAEGALADRILRLRRLREIGAEVLPLAADVSDPAALSAVFASALERFGRIDGAIHAAGVPGGGIISLRTRESLDAELAAKVRGTLVLADLCRQHDLDFLVLCSSLNAFAGQIGQVGYCAANAFQDAYAHELTAAAGLPTLSINWSRWQGVGMAADVERQHRAVIGRELSGGIVPEEGVRAFDRALASGLSQIIVSPEDFKSWLRQMQHVDVSALEDLAPRPFHERPSSLRSDYVAPSDELEEQIAGVWREVFGLDRIGIHDDFFELGGDSLVALQMVSRLTRTFGLELRVRDLFESATVAGLAVTLENRMLAEASPEELAEALTETEGIRG